MKGLLTGDDLPTAVFIANDLMALGACEAFFEAGLKIPDDIELAFVIRPGLTTILQPEYKLGVEAAKMLIEKVESTNNTQPEDKILEANLVVRNSTYELK